MSEINYSIARTISLGDFEFVKIQVGLTLQCEDGNKKSIEIMYRRAKKFVDQKIEEETKEWQT